MDAFNMKRVACASSCLFQNLAILLYDESQYDGMRQKLLHMYATAGTSS
jgi:hypothetical protein